MWEDDNQFKITCQLCNGFVTCSDSSGDLLYITFINYGIYTLGIYPEELVPEITTFFFPLELKYNAYTRIF